MKPWIKRNFRRTLLGLFGTGILLGGLTACGHSHPSFGARMDAQEYQQMRDKMVDRAAGKLDLNADQKKRLQVLADQIYTQRSALMGTAVDPREQLKSLVASDKFDQTRALALINEKTTALQSGSPQVITAMADFYDSLNAGQQQKVRDFLEGRRGWFHRG
jgi:Spy/CpxP family protein refolding chaperone